MDDENDNGDDDSSRGTVSESKRVSRNMNEKKRRDRFNVLIGELAAVIPNSTASNSKFDKTTVLKKAVSYLRNHQNVSNVVVSRPTTHWQPAFVNDGELNQLLLEAMNAFVLVLDGSGIINFVSDSIISLLGYRPSDVVNNSIADFLDQADESCIFAHLALLEKLKSPSQKGSNTHFSSLPVSKIVNFELTLTSGPCFNSQKVEVFSCIGQAFNTTIKSQNKLQMVLVCNLRSLQASLIQPITNVASKEFTSRLTLDWKFNHIDSRAMNIIGYQGTEIAEVSIYRFIHTDDIANVKSYHEMLVRKGRITTCYYRFLTKGDAWIWLRSCCYISYNQWNSKPEYVTANTNLINFDEVYANQEVVVKNDRLQFQTITRDSKTDNSKKTENQRADSPLSFSSSIASRDADENASGLFTTFDTSAKKLSSQQKTQDDDSQTSSFSNFPLPEGLSPAQHRLHVQLQSKHQLLEQSIQHQISELQRIKRQIEINKQLWEFNRQLQVKKANKLGKTSLSSNSILSQSSSDCSTGVTSKPPEAQEPMQVDQPKNSNGTNEFPVSVYLGLGDLGDLDEGVGDDVTPQPLDNPSQMFALPQPYNYFHY